MGVASVGHLLCEMTPEDVMYITIPLYHTTAFGIGFGSSLLHGNPIVIRRKFSASQFWQDTRRYNVTIFTYVGEICRYLYNQPPKEDDKDNPVVKMVGNGLRNDYWKDFKTRFGIEKVAELYGATERFVPGFLNIHNLDCTIGTCFLPYAIVKYNTHTDKPILDENGHMIRVKKGEVGLLLGYVSPAEQKNFYIYTDPEQSKKKLFMNVFEDGDMFVNTGDLLRDIGYNHAQFVDRLGDTFRWKSQNVSTEEVEAVLNSYVQIEMSSVYGVLIPNTEGRAGMASIVTNKEEKFKFDSFYDLMKKYLPEYAIPKLIRLKNELDVTGTLKIKKANLKKEGYDLRLVKDPIHILLPGSSDYVPMTQEIFNNVVQGNYKF
jgi:citronellyl-CoA synthetase